MKRKTYFIPLFRDASQPYLCLGGMLLLLLRLVINHLCNSLKKARYFHGCQTLPGDPGLPAQGTGVGLTSGGSPPRKHPF